MNFLSSLFSGAKNLFGGAGKAISQGAQTLANPISAAVGAGSKLGQGFNPMSLFGGGGKGGTSSAGPQPFMNPVKSSSSPQSFSTGSFPVSVQASVPGFDGDTDEAKPGKKPGILDQIFPGGGMQGIAGLVAPLIGDMFAPKSPKIPDMSSLSSVQALQNFKPGGSVSPAYEAMLQRNVSQIRDQKVKDLQALYHNARPGTDYLTDSAYQRDLAKLDQDIQTNMSDDLARAELTFSQQEQEKLSQIAQMDIYSIMAQTGMEAQEAEQFKEMFSNIGNTFLTNATQKPETDLMSLFGGR